MKKQKEQLPENPKFHDTWLLLRKYRDVVWGLELSVQQVKRRFQMEFGSSIEDFLESIYIAGVDFSDNGIQEQARSIEKSYQMLKLLENSVNIMRNKHKNGEMYYWLLYYSYLSPQQYQSVDEIIEMLKPHISDISQRTFFRKPMSVVIFNLLYWSGMRSGELLALTLNDFDFEVCTVSITKNYARMNGEDLFLEPKTPKSNRKITLPQFVCDLVKNYADRLYGYSPSDRLFETTKHYLKNEMDRGCRKTGLKEIRVHDLRHSHASLLIELGFAPLLISERLGHESVTTTLEIYSHLYPTKQGEVASRLQDFA